MNRSVSTHLSVPHVAVLALLACGGVFAQIDAAVEAEVTEVVSQPLERSAVLPGELRAFQSVELYAKVSGFVEEIAVDRGSRVKQGQLLVRMTAPEIEARRVEAEAKIPAAMAQRIEAEAKLAAAQSTFERLTKAAETPGVVAGNDLILAEKSVDAEKARVDAPAPGRLPSAPAPAASSPSAGSAPTARPPPVASAPPA
jgi:membrane fusion protein, multidrug efflux system